MRVYGTELDGVLADTPAELLGTEKLAELFQVQPHPRNADVMNEWVYAGMVPSILTSRSPVTRSVTEAWCAKYSVPYSNFLLGIEPMDIDQILYHIDASFYITDHLYAATTAADSGLNVYVVRREWNQIDEEYLKDDYPTITFVTDFRDITKLERIGT